MKLSDYVIWRDSKDLGFNSRKTEKNRMFYALGLGGEVGEVENIIKKMIRDYIPEPFIREKIVDEMGDVFWYFIGVLNSFDIPLEECLEFNRDKLVKRHGTNKNQ